MSKLNFRLWAWTGFFACAAGLGFAYYLQYKGYEPCPMCIFQRLAMAACGLVFLAGALQGPKAWGRNVYSLLGALAALTGAGIAGRQVWIQHLPPDQVMACGPSLDYLLRMLPLSKVIATVLKGDGSCAEVTAQWLGLSLPLWTLIAFLALAGFAMMMFRWSYPSVR